MRLVSSSPGNTTGIDLSTNAFWRLCLGAAQIQQTPALALMVRYPPGAPENQIALLKVPVSVAQEITEVQRLAEVGLAGGSLDEDIKRLTEAFTMFKNNPRAPSQAVLEESTEQGCSLVRAYWQIHDWVFDGAQETITVNDVTDHLLKGFP